MDNYANYSIYENPERDDSLACEMCGDPIESEFNHDACNTEDAQGCHESEFGHFDALNTAANQAVDEAMGN